MNKEFSISDYRSIVEIICPVITNVFNSFNFHFTFYDYEEVTSVVIIKIFSNWSKYDATISSRSWFAKIASNCTKDYMFSTGKWRSRHVANILVETGDGDTFEPKYADIPCSSYLNPDYKVEISQLIEDVKMALNILDEQTSRALLLQAEGYSISEIAIIVGKDPNALKTQLSRGRTKLRKYIKSMRMADDYSEYGLKTLAA